MQDGRASTIYSAVDAACPELSIEAVEELCRQLPWVFISETPDNAAPNKRKMWFTHTQLPGNALYIPGGCCVHHCYRIVSATIPRFGRFSLSGDVYALAFVTHVYGHFDRLSKALRRLLEVELDVKKPCEVDDQELESWEQHNRALLSHTFMRSSLHTRARLDGIDDSFAPAQMQEQERATLEKVLVFLNGDARLGKVVHVCRGCCQSREESVEHLFSALMELDFLVARGGLPAESRWGTVSGTNAKAALGIMLYKLLPRVWRLAFPDWDSGGAALEEPVAAIDDDFHLTMKRKCFRVGKFFGERSSRATVMSFCTEPLDWLWRRLQYLDEQNCALMDIASKHRNPFKQAQAPTGTKL